MAKVAIIFSCDANYFPLAKGLVLSLRQFGIPNADISLNLVDVGCAEEDLAWLERHGVRHVRFSIPDYYNFSPDVTIKSHYGSLLCRPFMPSLFPDHDIYLHIDSDMWVQEESCLYDYITICRDNPEKVVITPCVDYSYLHDYEKTASQINAIYRMYNAMYGDEIGRNLYARPILSCGMFAIRNGHPIWEQWLDQLRVTFNQDYHFESDKPAAEQLAFNYLLYTHKCFIPLSATHNYQCHAGAAVRSGHSGKVVVGIPPWESIGILHLTCATTNMRAYYRYALLFDQGRYLDERDVRTLKLA